MKQSTSGRAGFTLLELIIVIAIIGILSVMILPNLKDPPRRAREAVLKNNLRLVREAIMEYYASEGLLPASLYDLVDKGYLGSLPYDPIAGSKDTWIAVPAETGDSVFVPQTEGSAVAVQILDVRSGAEGLSLRGVPYSAW